MEEEETAEVTEELQMVVGDGSQLHGTSKEKARH